ncbi:MAG TPA: hypothetical protein VG939_16815 [Caulobacteraceae bacterium]|nr:hypothetical protein [Caulobacteraceae bacterium]
MAAKIPSSIPVARGQRVWREVVFEPDPELAAKVQFVYRHDGPLPPDEHSVERDGVLDGDAATDAGELAASPSAWEAVEDDDED